MWACYVQFLIITTTSRRTPFHLVECPSVIRPYHARQSQKSNQPSVNFKAFFVIFMTSFINKERGATHLLCGNGHMGEHREDYIV